MEVALKEILLSKGKEWLGIDIDPSWIQFQPTRKGVRGDVTLMVFPFAKALQLPPAQVAELIGKHMKSEVSFVADFEVIQGFLNFVFSKTLWSDQLIAINQNDSFGLAEPDSKQMVMVEYASPNTNKPLHLGHLRNIFLGYAVAQLKKSHWHQVIKNQLTTEESIFVKACWLGIALHPFRPMANEKLQLILV
jgi:arginyl-tRNA synthetase